MAGKRPEQILEKSNVEFDACFATAAVIAHACGAAADSLICTKRGFCYNPQSKMVFEIFPHFETITTDLGKLIDMHAQVLEENVDKAESWKIMGHCYLTLNDFPNALAAYGHALSLDQNSRDLVFLYGLGVCYHHFKYNENAISVFCKILRLDPQFQFASDIRFRLGILYRNLKRYEKSLEHFHGCVNNPPHSLTYDDVAFQIAYTMQLSGAVDRAIADYEQLMHRHPNVSEIAQQYLLVLQNHASFDDAIRTALEKYQTDPTIHLIAARRALKTGNVSDAHMHYKYCLPYFTDDPLFWVGLGIVYFRNNQHDDATAAFQRALFLQSTLPEAWINIGVIQVASGSYDKAIQTLQQGYQKCPDSSELCRLLDLLKKGNQERMEISMMDVSDAVIFTDIPVQFATQYACSVPALPSTCFQNGEIAESFEKLASHTPSLFTK